MVSTLSPATTPSIQQTLPETPILEQTISGHVTQNTSPSSTLCATPSPLPSFSYPNHGQVNMLHLELLHHVSTVTCVEFQRQSADSSQAANAIVKMAMSAPFLMHELLAIGALHLSTLKPDHESRYSYHASELQSYALSIFNSLSAEQMAENPAATFLFTSFLGIHVLFDTLLFRPADFSQFVERFVGYLRIHSGVYTCARGTWSALQSSELEPLLNVVADEVPGHECDMLISLVRNADLSQTSVSSFFLPFSWSTPMVPICLFEPTNQPPCRLKYMKRPLSGYSGCSMFLTCELGVPSNQAQQA